MGIQITPSILNADFAALGAEVARTPSADWIHVDVMDNHFVPNLTFGPTMVEALARSTDTPLDAHLMIADADRHAPTYVEAGCASVTFHVEAAAVRAGEVFVGRVGFLRGGIVDALLPRGGLQNLAVQPLEGPTIFHETRGEVVQ